MKVAEVKFPQRRPVSTLRGEHPHQGEAVLHPCESPCFPPVEKILLRLVGDVQGWTVEARSP